jgi:hypothetical protein
MSFCAHLESNSLKIRTKKYCEQKLQRKMKYLLYVQHTCSLSLLVFDIINVNF